ncbi:MAG: DUF134 domain-containing protein [Actinomycetota bacterium]|jgi:predicted DNA-binding protein (UPF0251 family)|nr:DUF134 domain-containing protein [Actinomycetota bacterium]
MTARPRIKKIVDMLPLYVLYKPMGVAEQNLETESLTLEEMEALKLKDGQDLKQEEAAKQMGISRSTFQRLLHAARKKIINAILEGKAIRFEGGNYIANENIISSKCVKGNYHFFIKKDELKDQQYKISKIKCPKCGKRLVDFK